MKKNIIYRSITFILFAIFLSGCSSNKLNSQNTSTSSLVSQKNNIPNHSETSGLPESTTEIKPTISLEEIKTRTAGSIIKKEELMAVDPSKLFYASEITDDIFQRINGISFSEDCITQRKDLRYLRLLYTDLNNFTHIGELICNKSISDDLLDIFEELYDNQYPIEKMVLVDEYNGDDNSSMADNNTSCFNFRVVPGQSHLSQHAYGRAIDINPRYNPYIDSDGTCLPDNGKKYEDRNITNPYKIDENDLCYQLFVEHGFTWGGNWDTIKDYQHFQKKEE